MNLREIDWEVVGWMHLVQDWDWGRPYKHDNEISGSKRRRRISWTASQVGLCSTKLDG
jgi:hypothetical protein